MAYSKKEIEDIFEQVCKEIEKGAALRNVLKGKGFPSTATFYKWMDKDTQKIKRYAHATAVRADLIFDDIINIADQNEGDTYVNSDGKVVVNNDVIQRSRLRIDARKWVLGKLNPKKYGEHQSVDLTSQGEKINTTPNITVNVIPPIEED